MHGYCLIMKKLMIYFIKIFIFKIGLNFVMFGFEFCSIIGFEKSSKGTDTQKSSGEIPENFSIGGQNMSIKF